MRSFHWHNSISRDENVSFADKRSSYKAAQNNFFCGQNDQQVANKCKKHACTEDECGFIKSQPSLKFDNNVVYIQWNNSAADIAFDYSRCLYTHSDQLRHRWQSYLNSQVCHRHIIAFVKDACHQLPTLLFDVAAGTWAFSILTSSMGLSFWSVSTIPIRLITSIPRSTRPKMVCLPSSHWVGASVMKNWLPLVFGPLFAIDKIPAPDTHTVVTFLYWPELYNSC